MPSTASASCQRISGRSGEPKLRQSVTPSGRPPAHDTLRAASQTARAAPRRGSRKTWRPLPSTATAMARRVPFTRRTLASEPGSTSVLMPTCWSYCRYAHSLDAIAGEPSSATSASPQSGGSGSVVGSNAWSAASPAGGAHVLDADDRAGRHRLQARLQQELLGERIAHLHRRPARLGVLVERRRRHRGAVDAVSARLVADVEHGIADALGPRAEDPVGAHEPHAHDVHQRVAGVFRRERDLAADGRAAEAVAVPRDPRDDALNEPPGP